MTFETCVVATKYQTIKKWFPSDWNFVMQQHLRDVLSSGCGTVGRAVASNTRCPQFESSHRQFLVTLSTALKR